MVTSEKKTESSNRAKKLHIDISGAVRSSGMILNKSQEVDLNIYGVSVQRHRRINRVKNVIEKINTDQKINIIRNGLNAKKLEEIASYYKIPQKILIELTGTPKSTFSKKIKENARLSKYETEILMRILELGKEAEMVFGGVEEGAGWLLDYNAGLKAIPLTLLDTEQGTNAVRETLGSILYGGVA